MSAVTETGRKITEFSGEYRVYAAKIDGQAGSAGTLTIAEFSEIAAGGVQMTFAQAPTTDCRALYVHDISANVITFASVENDYTINTQNALDFYVTVIGK
jgi:hypothetical protein